MPAQEERDIRNKNRIPLALSICVLLSFVVVLVGPASATIKPIIPPRIIVWLDIKPESWPNPLQLKGKGVLPVAICGTGDFDVTTIAPPTIMITLPGSPEGAPPIRWSYEDVATPYMREPCSGHDLGPDGYADLSLKFKTQEVIETLGLDAFSDRDMIILIVTGNLKAEHGGTLILGLDCVVILS